MNALLCTVALASAVSVKSDDFKNLDFDSGYVPPDPAKNQWIPLSGLSGWRPQIGGKDVDHIGWNNVVPLGRANISIVSGSDYRPFQEGVGALFLQGGPLDGFTLPKLSASVEQTGIVPSNANSLLFRGALGLGSEIQINGITQPIYYIGSVQYSLGRSVAIYGVDVSEYAGREMDLRLMATAVRGETVDSMFVDSMRFSAQSVPESGAGILLGIGVLLVACAKTASRTKR